MHRADLYIVLRKLVAQIQAFPQRIYETTMVRFYSTVDPNHIVVIWQVACDGAFHVIPHPSLPRRWTKTEWAAALPTRQGYADSCHNLDLTAQFSKKLVSSLRKRHGLGQRRLPFVGRYNFLDTHLVNKVIALQVA